MNEFKSMTDAFKEMFQDNILLQKNNEQFELQKIIEQILGDKIMNYVKQIKIQHHNVIIYTDESVLKNELKLAESHILKQINNISSNHTIDKIIII